MKVAQDFVDLNWTLLRRPSSKTKYFYFNKRYDKQVVYLCVIVKEERQKFQDTCPLSLVDSLPFRVVQARRRARGVRSMHRASYSGQWRYYLQKQDSRFLQDLEYSLLRALSFTHAPEMKQHECLCDVLARLLWLLCGEWIGEKQAWKQSEQLGDYLGSSNERCSYYKQCL